MDANDQFFGRISELTRLESIYSAPGSGTCIVLGRRRIGKSTLLERFCKDKHSLYIQFSSGATMESQLEIMATNISTLLGEEGIHFDTLGDAMDAIGDICKNRKTVIVFDEFPYLVECAKDVSGRVKDFLDLVLKRTDSMFIICGSVMSVMMNEAADPSRPLFQRFDNIMTLAPLPIEDCRGFHPNLSESELMDVYLMFGGIPRFHRKMSGMSYDDILVQLAMDSDWMSMEASLLIRSELNNPDAHERVVDAISNGRTTATDIANGAGLPISTCDKYLDDLVRIGIVGIRKPMMGASTRPNYYILDSITAFHREILSKNESRLRYRDRDRLAQALRENVATFLGKRFEILCTDFFSRNYLCDEIGSWWGKIDGEDTDIDVVAIAIDDNGLRRQVFGECKHRMRPVTWATLNELQDKVKHLRNVVNPTLVLFSWSGFKENLLDDSEDMGIMLIGLDALTGRGEAPPLPPIPSKMERSHTN